LGQAVAALERPPLPPSIDQALIPAALRSKELITNALHAGFAAMLVLLLAVRAWRQRRQGRNLIEIRYDGGQSVRVPKETSVLEASRIGGIPHHSVCGGRGRCSTCRVRVTSCDERLPPPLHIETTTLRRI